jgi:hypothetical protein
MTGGGRDSTLCELAGSLIVRTDLYAEDLLPNFVDSSARIGSSSLLDHDLSHI